MFLRRCLFVVVLSCASLGSGLGVRAQDPLFLVNDATRVESVAFKFVDTQSFEPARLQLQIATAEPGYFESGWRASVLSKLPLFGEPGVYPFNPIELQKDVIRLRRFYGRNGFPRADTDYLVRYDSSSNQAAVLFTIREGPPILIDSLWFAAGGSRPITGEIAPELVPEWQRFRQRIAVQQGERLDDFRLVQLQDQTLSWFRENGYAFADVSAESRVDTVALTATVRIKVNAGPRGRYDTIRVEGAESVDPIVVLRELPFKPGDPFQQSELIEGQRQIFGLNLFQLAAVNTVALGEAPAGQPRDSTVDIRVLVNEGPARIVNALTGYYSEGGLTGSAQWTHRNFFGGARSFTASVRAQTGIAAFSIYPKVDYEARLSLRQPYLGSRRLSGAVSPFARFRDDEIERATSFGASASVLYEIGQLQNVTLGAGFTRRTVGADTLSLVDVSTLLPGSSFSITRGQVRLSGVYGLVDDALNPQSGFIVRPSATLTGLGLSDVDYAQAEVTATLLVPFSERTGLVARVNAGTLFPFSGSDPATAFNYLALRDDLLFAGGTTDVRGWGSNLLGPKFIDFTFVDADTTLAGVQAQLAEDGDDADPVATYYRVKYGVRYRPLGAESKVSGSLQLNLPLPLGPQWGASVFADAGRILNPAEGLYDLYSNATGRFPNLPALIATFRADEPTVRFGTGAGIQYLTPVGFLSFAIGVKLNPSEFDLRDPIAVFRAADIENLRPGPPDFSDIEEQWFRRLQFHLSIGQRF